MTPAGTTAIVTDMETTTTLEPLTGIKVPTPTVGVFQNSPQNWARLMAARKGLYFGPQVEFRIGEEFDYSDMQKALESQGMALMSRIMNGDSEESLYVGHDLIAFLESGYFSSLQVYAKTWEKSCFVTDFFRKKFIAPEPEVTESEVCVNIWYNTTVGPQNMSKHINRVGWKGIRNNYRSKVQTDLDFVMKHRPVQKSGVIVWTGPAGTGKTTAVRSLATEWDSWCNTHIIADTEKFLNDVGYLHGLCASASENYANLIVLEDAGELLTMDARQNSGQALSRLLNFTDGILGQGLNTYFLITTNEQFDSLHAAVARPGRAIPHGVTNFANLTWDEGQDWLKRNNVRDKDGDFVTPAYPAREGVSLATLYGIMAEHQS